MDVFGLQNRLIQDYPDSILRFINIEGDLIRGYVKGNLIRQNLTFSVSKK
jgi:hypothetical protein